jgi:GNAT superfamily N-acetyltransferase
MNGKERQEVEFRVRRMTEADAEAVNELVSQLGYPDDVGKTETAIRAVLGSEVVDAFVAEDREGRVIGWAHVFMVPFIESGPNAELGGLVVDEKYRGSGAGRALVERVEAWAREHGAADLCLRSNIVRDGAHKFYEHLGFEVQKTQHKFRKKLGPGGPGSGAVPSTKKKAGGGGPGAKGGAE